MSLLAARPTLSLVLLLLLGSTASGQPVDGLPGGPVRGASSAAEGVAPATTSVAPFVGRWVLRGFTNRAEGEPLPTLVRLTVRQAAGGGLSLERRWEVTQPDGSERRSAVDTCEVRVVAVDRLEARLSLVHRPALGLAGAISGAPAATEVTNEVEWRLVVGAGGARELTKNLTGRAPEHAWTGSNVTGQRLQVQDLVSAPVKTLVNHGSPRDRYDLTFVADGYTAADLPVFRRHVRDVVARLKATTPFREYWSYVNVHRVEVASRAPGVVGGRGGPSALGTRIPTGVPANRRIPSGNDALVTRAAARAPGADAIVVLCFDPFRSVATEGHAFVSTWEDRFPRVAVHELGHTIGLLLDEYGDGDPSGWDFLSANALVEGIRRLSGWGVNVTTHTDRDAVPWRHWLPPGVAVPTPSGAGAPVGVYAGAYHMERRWHRPSPTCLMREVDQPFCVACREQLILKLSEKTNPVTVRKEQLDEDTVRLTVTTTIPGAHRFVWRRGAGFVVGSGSSSIIVRRKDVSWGDTTLWLQVQDLTPWVRRDERGHTRYDLTFVLRKGLVWDRGLECVGPIPGRPSGGGSSGLPF